MKYIGFNASIALPLIVGSNPTLFTICNLKQIKMTKTEALEHVKSKPSIGIKEFRSIITSLTVLRQIPERIKKGDVIIIRMGVKSRPSVVVKVLKDVFYVMPLTTTEDNMNLVETYSRIFGKGYFSRAITAVDKEYAFNNWAGVYDNTRALNRAIKAIKKEIIGL